MKLWLTGVLTLLMATSARAENYNIASSRSKNLDVWIDNVKSRAPQDWCARQVPLRIVLKGDNSTAVLDDFMPKVGALMVRACGKLTTLNWHTEDASGKLLAQGSAQKASGWQAIVTPEAPQPPAVAETSDASVAPAVNPAELSASRHHATAAVQPAGRLSFPYRWKDEDRTSALFVPAKEG